MRWVGGSRYLLARVGNRGLREFQEENPDRKIRVWANEMSLFDLDTGQTVILLPEVSWTAGFDFAVAPAKEEPLSNR